ncbi:MAG: cation:proton antiporter [Balneolales bacterium]
MDIVWVGFAFVIGLLVSRIHIPPLVGYLIAGLVLAAFGYEPGIMMGEIAHLGVLFLLFSVGLHIRLGNILQREVLGVGFIHLAISTLLFFPLSLYFGLGMEAAVIVSITLGFSSTVLAAKNLELRNEIGAYYGRVAIGILIIQDLVAMGIIAYAGGGIPSYWAALLLGLPLLRPLLSRLMAWIQRDELLLLMALSLAIGGDALFEIFHLSGELGALVMGMLLATDKRGEELGKKIWGIKEAFLVGFFLQVGLTGFPVDANAYAFIGIMLALLPVKAVLFFLLFMIFSLRARTGYQSTMTLTAYSEFTLIAGSVAAANNLVPGELIVVLGLMTAVSYATNSILVRYEDFLWERSGKFLTSMERVIKHHDHQPESFGAAEYLVVGMGTTGLAAYDTLKNHQKRVLGMDIDPDRVKQTMEDGRRVIVGDVQDLEMWNKLDLSKLKGIILAMSSDIELKLHALSGIASCPCNCPVYVLTLNKSEEKTVKNKGGIPISVPSLEIGKKMAELCMGGH